MEFKLARAQEHNALVCPYHACIQVVASLDLESDSTSPMLRAPRIFYCSRAPRFFWNKKDRRVSSLIKIFFLVPLARDAFGKSFCISAASLLTTCRTGPSFITTLNGRLHLLI